MLPGFRLTLGFTLLYRDADPAKLAVIARDGVEMNLFDSQDKHLAEWTSLRIKVPAAATVTCCPRMVRRHSSNGDQAPSGRMPGRFFSR